MTQLENQHSSSTNPNSGLITEGDSNTNPSYNELITKFSADNPNSYLNKILLTLAFSSIRPFREIEPYNYTSKQPPISADYAETIKSDYDKNILTTLETIFNQGAKEVFYDGEQSWFSQALTFFINKHGLNAFKALNDFLFTKKQTPSITAEALNWISEIRHAPSMAHQWYILEKMLEHSNAKIRDAAVLGFSIIDDPKAIPLLRKTEEIEPIPEIKQLIRQVITQIEEDSK